MAALISQFPDVDRATVRRRLKDLEEAGMVERVARGTYQLAVRQLGLDPHARELVDILAHAGLEAHLTGLDLLLPYVHQFVRHYPHLVNSEPASLDAAEFELSAKDFVVAQLNGASTPTLPDPSRLVLLRSQPNSDQYGVHGYVAPREKAWVDLLRETARGNVAMQFTELGRILDNLLDAGADERKLRRYARQLGYRDWLDRAFGDTGPTGQPAIEALRDGLIS